MLDDADLKGRRLAQYLFSELEKIAASEAVDPKISNPKAGKVLAFDPSFRNTPRKPQPSGPGSVVEFPKLSEVRGALSELLQKLAQGMGPVQQQGEQQIGPLEGGVQREVEGEEEAPPSHGVVASRVEHLGDKKARGIPVLQPPPGFVYAPHLQAFVPNPQDPGWMQAEQAAEAAKAQAFYAKGQEDLQTQQAEQAAAQQAYQLETQEMAKQEAKATMGGLQTPSNVRGDAPTKKTPKKKSKKSSGKDVTIKIGR